MNELDNPWRKPPQEMPACEGVFALQARDGKGVITEHECRFLPNDEARTEDEIKAGTMWTSLPKGATVVGWQLLNKERRKFHGETYDHDVDAGPAEDDPDKDRGVYEKFTIKRTDGSSEKDGKHHECNYFVLDLSHDPFCRPALKSYAMACKGEYPDLAHDIMEALYPPRGGVFGPSLNIDAPNPKVQTRDWEEAARAWMRLAKSLDPNTMFNDDAGDMRRTYHVDRTEAVAEARAQLEHIGVHGMTEAAYHTQDKLAFAARALEQITGQTTGTTTHESDSEVRRKMAQDALEDLRHWPPKPAVKAPA